MRILVLALTLFASAAYASVPEDATLMPQTIVSGVQQCRTVIKNADSDEYTITYEHNDLIITGTKININTECGESDVRTGN